MKTHAICLALAAAALAAASGRAAQAEPFPSHTVTIVVPYAPGVTDQQVRVLAPVLGKLAGQTFLVENRAGAGGAIGARVVSSAAPDGHTLLYAAPAVITTLPLLQKTPYGLHDFTPVARVTSSPHVMAIRAGAPYGDLAGLIAYAKANPGKVRFGSSGTGTAVHLAGEAFARAAGISIQHIPFKGLSEAITQVLGGDIDLVIGLPLAIMPLVKDGKMKAVAQFGAERSPLVSSIPTLKEQGVDLTLSVDIGLFGPKGMDPAVVAAIDKLVSDAMASDAFKAYVGTGVISSDYMDASAYAKTVEADAKSEAQLVQALGLGK